MNILGLVVFSVALGIVIGVIGEDGKPMKNFFKSLEACSMKLIGWVIMLELSWLIVVLISNFKVFSNWNHIPHRSSNCRNERSRTRVASSDGICHHRNPWSPDPRICHHSGSLLGGEIILIKRNCPTITISVGSSQSYQVCGRNGSGAPHRPRNQFQLSNAPAFNQMLRREQQGRSESHPLCPAARSHNVGKLLGNGGGIMKNFQ